jgi:tripartite-type tricarboxylate transporter receptor subunit TctC
LLQALGAATLLGPAAAHAQAYPAKPIRIVHGYDNGSNPDTVSRILSPSLSERLGQAIVTEPRPGAGGRIATAYVATQEPDGYTLMMLTAGDTVIAATDPKLSYDLLRDYAFITTVVEFPFILMVPADSPIKTLRDLIAAAKASPGKLTFATPGVRTTQHLSGELFKLTAGVDLLHVPFKGSAFTDLIGGRLDSLIAAPAVSTPQIKGGKVRAIGVTSRQRIDAFPDLPTFAETLPGFEVYSWLGLAAPAKTPGAIVERLGAEVRTVIAQDSVRAKLLATGSLVGGGTPEAFRARAEADIRKWKGLAEKVRLDP